MLFSDLTLSKCCPSLSIMLSLYDTRWGMSTTTSIVGMYINTLRTSSATHIFSRRWFLMPRSYPSLMARSSNGSMMNHGLQSSGMNFRFVLYWWLWHYCIINLGLVTNTCKGQTPYPHYLCRQDYPVNIWQREGLSNHCSLW